MEGLIDADSPLDYATIQILPAQNRYEVFVCGGNEIEKLAVGVLEQLLPHLVGVNNLYARGSNANFKLQIKGEVTHAAWFTKSTLHRFLRIIGSPYLMNTSKAIEGEMSQLEEARNFHLSLYAQGHQDNFKSEETDGCNSIETAPKLKGEVEFSSSDASKNELLQAMELRLIALKRELAAALNNAVGTTCSSKEITELVDFCDHFGAKDLKNSLGKILELTQKSNTSIHQNDEKHSVAHMSKVDNINETDGDAQISRYAAPVTLVKYHASTATVAQVERHSSTEDESSSDSSGEYRASAERSRALTRSAAPRRSASPMWRIQIGRTGSRRAAAITIKSLNYYPGRERTSARDVAGNSSEEEGSEHPSKKPETNVRRMSVQDAINLFESKQKDQTVDVQKRSSSSSLSLATNKSVLRRWSAGVLECPSPCQQECISEDSVPLCCNDVVDKETSKNTIKEKLDSDFTSASENPVVTNGVDRESERWENGAHDTADTVAEINAAQGQESNGKSTASSEWSRQKEMELSQMLRKMMESQPVRTRKPEASIAQHIASDQRGGFYNQYKEKRDKKLRGEYVEKKAEKDEKFRAMQKILDERKAEMAFSNAKDDRVAKAHPLRKSQKSLKSPAQHKIPRTESPKSSVTRKVSSKTPTLPATRKSWPSTPSARTVSSPSKTPVGVSSGGTTPTSRKPQSTPSLPRSSAKTEKPQPCHRSVKKIQTNADRSLVKEKMQQTVRNSGRTTKMRISAAAGDTSGMVPSKPSFYNKGTKRSSVVPLESKPFIRKASGAGSGINAPLNKTKQPPQLEESSGNPGNVVGAQEVAVNTSVLVCEQQDQHIVSPGHFDTAMQSESRVNDHQLCDETVINHELSVAGNDGLKDVELHSAEIESQEESVIPSIAWVEIEEHQDMPKSYDDGTSQVASPVRVAPIGLSTVRHSLSQMLLEDNSESDTAEWGNAENPPAVVYQKDAPKGLKRLLKFARKSKGDANVAGWSSPSVFSEGEEDAEESRAISKRNTDNLLRKAALHSKDYGQPKNSFFEGHEKNMGSHEFPSGQTNIGKFLVQSSHKLHHSSTSAPATKATRSFFSLSAFRGSKPNETKFQ